MTVCRRSAQMPESSGTVRPVSGHVKIVQASREGAGRTALTSTRYLVLKIPCAEPRAVSLPGSIG
jgi:hypothetical protein